MSDAHRIGFLSGDHLDFGGVETHLLSIFRLLQKTGFESILIAPASDKFTCLAKSLGVRCVFWDPKNMGCMEKINSLRIIFSEHQLSLLHIHSPGVAIEGRIAAYLSGIPAIMTMHLQPADYFSKSTLKQKTKLMVYSFWDCVLNYLITEKIIYVSDRAYARSMTWKYSPKKRSVVIPNGVELPLGAIAKRNIRNLLGTPQERIVLCFVGRLEPQKGLDILINALRLIPQPVLDTLELWVVGTGSVKHNIELLSQSLKLQNHVRFLGYQENTKIYLAESDIFMLPSNYEALSISLLDAMAHGLPCIVTDTGENSRLITHGVDGFVVPIGNARALSSLLAVLATDSAMRERMGRSARAKADKFPESEMVSKIKSIYWAGITRMDEVDKSL